MSDVESITLTIPSGSLGVEIEPTDDGTGVLVVVKRAFVSSPLAVGDVITSVNGVQLATLPGGFNAWVNLIRDTANRQRSLGVTRAVAAAPSKAPAASPFLAASAPPNHGAEFASAQGVRQSAPSKAVVVEGEAASSDDGSMSETDSNVNAPRTVASPSKAPAASPISVASAPSPSGAEFAPNPSEEQSSPIRAMVIEGDAASSDDESMSEIDSNLDGTLNSLDHMAGAPRTVAAPPEEPAAASLLASELSTLGTEFAPNPSARQSAASRAMLVEGDMASSDDESMSETDSNLDGSSKSLLDHAAIRARALAMLGLSPAASAADDDAEEGPTTASGEDDDDDESSSESSESSAASAIDHQGVHARAESLLLQLSSGASGLEPPTATFTSGGNHSAAKPEVAERTSRLHTAPAPPMWRFQNKAKKSEGYSSAAAGSYIAGKSSSELAAKYVAPADGPNVSLYKKSETGEEIGQITASIPKTNAFVKTDREVGQFNLTSQGGREGAMQDLPAGTFNGNLSKPENFSPESRQPFREFNKQYEVSETKARDIEQHPTGNVQDSWSWEEGFSSEKQVGPQVDRLQFKDSDEDGEEYIGAISKSDLEEIAILSNDSDEYSDRDGMLLLGTTASTAFEPSDSQKDSQEDIEMDVEIGQEVVSKSLVDVRPRKRQRCLYLILLLLLLAVAILGVLLGTNRGEGAAAAAAVPPVLIILNATNSSQPSTSPSVVSSEIPSASPEEMPSGSPSLSPTRECPLGTKAVTVEYVEHSESYIPPSSATNFANQQYTWSVSNACYGNTVATCLPCPVNAAPPESSSGLSSTVSLNENVRTRVHRVDETVFEDNSHPGECRDPVGLAYDAIRILEMTGGADDQTAAKCGRLCGTMPRPSDQVGFQYGPTRSFGAVYCRCLYEAGTIPAVNEIPGNWPKEPGNGGRGRPEPHSVVNSGVRCYPVKMRSEVESPSLIETPTTTIFDEKVFEDNSHPGECRDPVGLAYDAIRTHVVGTATGCGRLCGTMPRPSDQVGFEYGPTRSFDAVYCRCLYEAGTIPAVNEIPGNWPKEPGNGGRGRPEPHSVVKSGVRCYPAKMRSEVLSESPSIIEPPSTTICLPDMQEFYFEVSLIPTDDGISPCCGLTSNLAPRVTYDDVVVAEDGSPAYFGEKEGGCQSQLPSVAPTERPSTRPSPSPSEYPSAPPSLTPTSSAPTLSPVVFAGPCPEEFVPLSYYSVGTRISRDGIIYECIRVSCGSYGFDPGSSASSLWRQSWDIVGSCAGTFKPTMAPSRLPTDNPTKTVS